MILSIRFLIMFFRNQTFGSAPYCFLPKNVGEGEVSKAFAFGPYLSTSRPKAIDVETACSEDCLREGRLVDMADEKFYQKIVQCWVS